MNREVVTFTGYSAKHAVDNLNGYCCNNDMQPIQIQVVGPPGAVTIVAIVEKHTFKY